jgi:cysteinyl-tRNA synthetase
MFGLFRKQKAVNLPPVTIKLLNSKTRELETFAPVKAGKVTMYSCGPTVYDHIHIGNLRAYLVPDLLTRLFRSQGYQVESTINFTDFGHLSDDADAGEDKILRGMRKAGAPITLEAMRDFAEPYIASFKRDTERFGNHPATTYARASDYVSEQISLIKTLEQKGYTYETSDGVYFDIGKFSRYGELGNVDVDAMRAGARVEVNEEKRHPADFALWKKGELGWESAWGTGFPGWHIECTAMVFATLGKHIDIHTGGEDLMYTHHNGEIAQAECATGKSYVNYWLHNAHVTIGDEKIAKSAGNGLTLDQLIAHGFSPISYRYWLLQSHYRSPVNFSIEALKAANEGYKRLQRITYQELAGITPSEPPRTYAKAMAEAMANDLDSCTALSTLWKALKDNKLSPGEQLSLIYLADDLLGLNLKKSADEGQAELGYLSPADLPEEITNLVDAREAARIAQNWAEADRLREALTIQGYQVEDTPDGPRVSKQ